MKMVNDYMDVVKNERTVCVFTNQTVLQQNLSIRDDKGSVSHSGIWKLNMRRMEGVKKVIVYYRHQRNGVLTNEIIVGDFVGSYQGPRPNGVLGYYIQFDNIRRYQTNGNWFDFTNDRGQSPVKYFF
jgi:hypothetical protein